LHVTKSAPIDAHSVRNHTFVLLINLLFWKKPLRSELFVIDQTHFSQTQTDYSKLES